ncbi:alpha-1,4-N-acetylglucosaminyltransferase-like [Dendrobates tinctorius]|uniref:alpha-1,4-N-acetylglucosaminyltransferase-like n=1 Tax=Dendrobates tinctorius TaxID=92724 RepID=UPI003CC9FA8D
MLKILRIAVFLLLVTTLGVFFGITHKESAFLYLSSLSRTKILNESIMLMNNIFSPIHGWSNTTNVLSTKASKVQEKMLLETLNTSLSSRLNIAFVSPSEVLKEGDGIIFLETTDRMQPPSLVLCAIESAARVYKNRPVAFFMKGLISSNIETVKRHFQVFSSLRNVYFFPLRFEEVFADTPLHAWYQKINSQQQSFWTHVSSDACRLALIGKYGGMYMDTDFISIQTIPVKDFLAAESSQYSSNGIFGFSPHHDFTQKCLEDFVKNYNSRIWGQQGPRLFTRILKKFCNLPKFVGSEDAMCGNFTLFNPQRFYPIICPEWKKYYKVWDKFPSFNDSYSLHLWNFMNKEKLTMVPGSNTLAEHLYKQYCPFTYNATFS